MSRPSFGELDGQDPYDILDLPSGASDAEVRAARKRLLRRYHPDLPTGDLRRTQMITAAADLLLDPYRKIGYYDLRDQAARRTPVPDVEPPVRASRPDDGARPSGARTDGHWFRPLAGADGRGPRPTAGPGWSRAAAPPNGGPAAEEDPPVATATGDGRTVGGRGRRHAPGGRRAAAYGGTWVPRPRQQQDDDDPTGEAAPAARRTVPAADASVATGGPTTANGGKATEQSQRIRPTFITPPDRAGSATGAGPARPTRSETRRQRTAGQKRTAVGHPAASSRWNALAVASVVTILTWTPIPLVLGLLALRQIRRFGQRGTRLAVTGVVFGAVFAFMYAYLLVGPSF